MTTVLVIEDTVDIRNMIEMALKMQKYEVITADNGADGIHAAQRHQPDLIICDVMMPYLNGYEVFKQLKAIDMVPRIPFIFATALDRPDDVRLGMVMGADDYIIKPFDVPDFLKIVDEVIKRRDLVVDDPENDPENDIFISYSHDDRQHMRLIREELRLAGFRVWSDEQIEAGDDWEDDLARMIIGSHCVVCILSENAANSKWVRRELGFAEANDTEIFPILVRGRTRYSVPLRLIEHQYIDARDAFDDGVQRLIQTIKDQTGIVPE